MLSIDVQVLAMSDQIIPSPENDNQVVLSQRDADHVAWVIQCIADACYVPGPIGKPWAGREETISKTMVRWEVEYGQAERLVDLAHQLLWNGGDDVTHVERATMRARLAGYRQVILNAMKVGYSIEKTYKYEPDPENPKLVHQVPFKEKRTPIDLNAAIARLQDIDRQIADLQGLHDNGSGGADTVAAMFRELEKLADGKEQQRTIAVATLKNAGRKKIVDAVKQLQSQKRGGKYVESKVKDKKEDGDVE